MARQSLTFSVGNLREVASCSKFSASISIFWKRTSALQLVADQDSSISNVTRDDFVAHMISMIPTPSPTITMTPKAANQVQASIDLLRQRRIFFIFIIDTSLS
jgi:hypothetical protein